MIAYVDGSCLKNGSTNSSGGFGVVVLDDNEQLVECHQKFCEGTTNNQEELKAILYVLLKYGYVWENLVVYSDSSYCVNSLTDWIFKWARNGWLKSDNQPPENLHLMKTFYDLFQRGYKMDLRKVKGHVGVKWNEIADGLATGRLAAADIK